MHHGVRVIGICILFGASFVAPHPATAQSLEGPAESDCRSRRLPGDRWRCSSRVRHLAFRRSRALRLAVVCPDAPDSLVRAVDATNFFFSFSLSMIGLTNIVMPFITDSPSRSAGSGSG